MSMRTTVLGTFTLACLTACIANPVTYADEGGTNRPFKGEAVGVINFTSPTTAIVDYTGKATHLGSFTRREFLSIDGPLVYGNMIFTTANGDELWLDFSGMFVSPTEAEGSYTFTGGTGRFEDATGEADFYAATDFVNVWVTFDGELSY